MIPSVPTMLLEKYNHFGEFMESKLQLLGCRFILISHLWFWMMDPRQYPGGIQYMTLYMVRHVHSKWMMSSVNIVDINHTDTKMWLQLFVVTG